MITISKTLIDQMIKHSFDENPNECCGILSGKNGNVSKLYKIANSASSPFRYVMDPKDMYNAMKDSEDNELDFMVFYHSHTHTPILIPMAADNRSLNVANAVSVIGYEAWRQNGFFGRRGTRIK